MDLHKTVLNDRTLWYDGDSTITGDRIVDSIYTNADLSSFFVDTLTPDIIRYNALVPRKDQIMVKTDQRGLTFDWDIPDEYKSIDIVARVSDKHYEMIGDAPDLLERELRCATELNLYRKYDLFDTLKALIYIINVLVEKNIVWGVGRGSSVSSYVLYVLGVHDVDSFQYDLDITEFLREPKT